MATCECLEGCPFFNDRMGNMPSISNVYKKKYCKSDFDSCARYRIFKALGKDKIPDDLFPNQTSRANKIINS